MGNTLSIQDYPPLEKKRCEKNDCLLISRVQTIVRKMSRERYGDSECDVSIKMTVYQQ